MGEGLEGDDARHRGLRRRRQRGMGGQRSERVPAGLDQLPEVAAVVFEEAVRVVIAVSRARIERARQRAMQLASVPDRVRARLLCQRIGVVVDRLERDQRAHHAHALRARGQHRVGGGTFEVAALLALGRERQLAQRRVGDRPRLLAPVAQLAPHVRVDIQPVARRGAGERDRKRGSFISPDGHA